MTLLVELINRLANHVPKGIQQLINAARMYRNELVGHLVGGNVLETTYEKCCERYTKLMKECETEGLLESEYHQAFVKTLNDLKNCATLPMSPIHSNDSLSQKLAKTDENLIVLTAKQQEFLNNLPRTKNRFLIRSPPGSGKTTLCIYLALRFLFQMKNVEETEQQRFLLLVHSDEFADHVTEILLKISVSCFHFQPI